MMLLHSKAGRKIRGRPQIFSPDAKKILSCITGITVIIITRLTSDKKAESVGQNVAAVNKSSPLLSPESPPNTDQLSDYAPSPFPLRHRHLRKSAKESPPISGRRFSQFWDSESQPSEISREAPRRGNFRRAFRWGFVFGACRPAAVFPGNAVEPASAKRERAPALQNRAQS
jgi:hypothetical protein